MTKIELAYPKIPDSKNCPLEKCIAFEKYDGTNLHWVWEPELRWYAFGTRRHRFDLDERGIAEFNAAHPGLEEAPQIFIQQLARPLEYIFFDCSEYRHREITVFSEFLGDRSFAGMHQPKDPKRLILFDVQVGQCLVDPEQFVTHFSSLSIAKIIYRGKLTGKFADDVRQGKYGVAEGVVCKGKNQEGIWMVKIKTHAYMNKLQELFRDDWQNYWE